jgi:hypothetical protein
MAPENISASAEMRMDHQESLDVESNLTRLFQPDELAAHEYQMTFKRIRPLEPEKMLMLAILEDAIMCFRRYLHAKHYKERRLHQDAASWIFDGTDIGTFSFENICMICGLEADYLRMGLLHWREQVNSRGSSDKIPEVSRHRMCQ